MLLGFLFIGVGLLSGMKLGFKVCVSLIWLVKIVFCGTPGFGRRLLILLLGSCARGFPLVFLLYMIWLKRINSIVLFFLRWYLE